MYAPPPVDRIELPPAVHAEQAVYGSRRSVMQRGYHLLAKSPGITGDSISQLNRWCPSHGALLGESTSASSLNFHPVGADLYAISRTVYGEPEFSNRGGLQVATMILVLNRSQLARYDNNPFAVVRMARAAGLLRWGPATLNHVLPQVQLGPAPSETVQFEQSEMPDLTNVLTAVLSGEPLILTAPHVSTQLLEALILQVRPEQRLGLSFTTGLKPSSQRPYRLHLVAEHMVRKLRLNSQSLPVLSLVG